MSAAAQKTAARAKVGVLEQQISFASRTLLGAEASSYVAEMSMIERRTVGFIIRDMRQSLSSIEAHLDLKSEGPDEVVARQWCELLEFLYVAGARMNYRLANLLEAASHLGKRALVTEEETVGATLRAFAKVCDDHADVVMRNGLVLRVRRLADHVEYAVHNTRAQESELKEGAATA